VCLEFVWKGRETVRVPNVDWQRVPDIWSGDYYSSRPTYASKKRNTCISLVQLSRIYGMAFYVLMCY